MITRFLSAFLLLVLALPAQAQEPTPRMRPEPQNYSTYLSDEDFSLFRQGLDAADDEDWELVADLRLRLSDTAARSVLLWRTVLSDPRATFLELNLALDELDNWPRDSFIRTEAEAKITDSGLSPPFIINWFDANPPTSGRGNMALAEALLADGRTEEGEALLRETWRTAYLSLTVQSEIYQRHRAVLTAEDHQARIDYLIWSDQTSAAR
jgi:soluble lytic murein transglycosylase